MIQVKYIDKIKNKQGVITHYSLIDKQGNKRIVTSQALKNTIKSGQIECINLTLTSDNRLVDKGIAKQSIGQNTLNKNQMKMTPANLYKAYINKMKMLGQRVDATYKIEGNDVLLEKVLLENGTFIIQPFVTGFVKETDSTGTTIVDVFQDCVNIKVINKSPITDMSYLFSGYWSSKLEKLDLSEFDTSHVTNMRGIFSGCYELQELNLNNIDTSRVTNMSAMFEDCTQLENLDVSSLNTSKVEYMGEMFSGCGWIEELDLSNFNTSKVVDMGYMFRDCKCLQTLNVSSFNTSNVEIMTGMFMGCKSMEELDIRNFDLTNTKYKSIMFRDCDYVGTFELPDGLE